MDHPLGNVMLNAKMVAMLEPLLLQCRDIRICKQFEGELVGLTEDNNIKVIIDGEEVDFTKKEVALIRLAVKF